MKKYSIWSDVKDGKLNSNIASVTEAIKLHDGKPIIITIEENKKKRSLNQNEYYWAVVVENVRACLEETQGETFNPLETHEFLKANFNYDEVINWENGNVFRFPKSTTADNTAEFNKYITRIREFAFNMFGVDIPEPKNEES